MSLVLVSAVAHWGWQQKANSPSNLNIFQGYLMIYCEVYQWRQPTGIVIFSVFIYSLSSNRHTSALDRLRFSSAALYISWALTWSACDLSYFLLVCQRENQHLSKFIYKEPGIIRLFSELSQLLGCGDNPTNQRVYKWSLLTLSSIPCGLSTWFGYRLPSQTGLVFWRTNQFRFYWMSINLA